MKPVVITLHGIPEDDVRVKEPDAPPSKALLDMLRRRAETLKIPPFPGEQTEEKSWCGLFHRHLQKVNS